MSNKTYKEIPSVQEILQEIGNEISVHENFIIRLVRNEIAKYREWAKDGKLSLTRDTIIKKIAEDVMSLSDSTIKNVINGTGIVLHTNFGRAPFGKRILQNTTKKLSGYVNLEVNLVSGKRGNRLDHLSDLIGTISNSDGGIIVNNNAAAVLLTLNTLS